MNQQSPFESRQTPLIFGDGSMIDAPAPARHDFHLEHSSYHNNNTMIYDTAMDMPQDPCYLQSDAFFFFKNNPMAHEADFVDDRADYTVDHPLRSPLLNPLDDQYGALNSHVQTGAHSDTICMPPISPIRTTHHTGQQAHVHINSDIAHQAPVHTNNGMSPSNNNDPLPAVTQPKKTRKHARSQNNLRATCESCRKLKIKCIPGREEGVCEKCGKRGTACVRMERTKYVTRTKKASS